MCGSCSIGAEYGDRSANHMAPRSATAYSTRAIRITGERSPETGPPAAGAWARSGVVRVKRFKSGGTLSIAVHLYSYSCAVSFTIAVKRRHRSGSASSIWSILALRASKSGEGSQ